MDKKQEARNRPHSSLVDVVLHEHELQFTEFPAMPHIVSTTTNLEPRIRTIRLGIVKVIVKNEGMMNAKNARALFQLGKGLKGDTTDYAVWGPIVRPVKTDSIPLPAWSGFEKMDNKALAELLRTEYFEDRTQYTMTTKMEVAPTFNIAACLFYTIQGDDRTYLPTAYPSSRPLPVETEVGLNIVMDDEQPSFVPVGKLILKRWNEMVYERPVQSPAK